MAAAVLVDSTYYIGRQKQRHDPFAELAPFGQSTEFLPCGMVVMEVCRGLHLESQKRRYRSGFAVMIYVPTTSRIWDLATDIALTLDRKGTPIPPQDSLIAAHALQSGAAVLTFDKHFSLVPGLVVLNTLD